MGRTKASAREAYWAAALRGKGTCETNGKVRRWVEEDVIRVLRAEAVAVDAQNAEAGAVVELRAASEVEHPTAASARDEGITTRKAKSTARKRIHRKRAVERLLSPRSADTLAVPLPLPAESIGPGGDERIHEVRRYFGYPIAEAAQRLRTSTTVLKRICRRNGVVRWPFRQVKALEHLSAQVKSLVAQSNEGGDAPSSTLLAPLGTKETQRLRKERLRKEKERLRNKRLLNHLDGLELALRAILGGRAADDATI